MRECVEYVFTVDENEKTIAFDRVKQQIAPVSDDYLSVLFAYYCQTKKAELTRIIDSEMGSLNAQDRSLVLMRIRRFLMDDEPLTYQPYMHEDSDEEPIFHLPYDQLDQLTEENVFQILRTDRTGSLFVASYGEYHYRVGANSPAYSPGANIKVQALTRDNFNFSLLVCLIQDKHELLSNFIQYVRKPIALDLLKGAYLENIDLLENIDESLLTHEWIDLVWNQINLEKSDIDIRLRIASQLAMKTIDVHRIADLINDDVTFVMIEKLLSVDRPYYHFFLTLIENGNMPLAYYLKLNPLSREQQVKQLWQDMLSNPTWVKYFFVARFYQAEAFVIDGEALFAWMQQAGNAMTVQKWMALVEYMVESPVVAGGMIEQLVFYSVAKLAKHDDESLSSCAELLLQSVWPSLHADQQLAVAKQLDGSPYSDRMNQVIVDAAYQRLISGSGLSWFRCHPHGAYFVERCLEAIPYKMDVLALADHPHFEGLTALQTFADDIRVEVRNELLGSDADITLSEEQQQLKENLESRLGQGSVCERAKAIIERYAKKRLYSFQQKWHARWYVKEARADVVNAFLALLDSPQTDVKAIQQFITQHREQIGFGQRFYSNGRHLYHYFEAVLRMTDAYQHAFESVIKDPRVVVEILMSKDYRDKLTRVELEKLLVAQPKAVSIVVNKLQLAFSDVLVNGVSFTKADFEFILKGEDARQCFYAVIENRKKGIPNHAIFPGFSGQEVSLSQADRYQLTSQDIHNGFRYLMQHYGSQISHHPEFDSQFPGVGFCLMMMPMQAYSLPILKKVVASYDPKTAKRPLFFTGIFHVSGNHYLPFFLNKFESGNIFVVTFDPIARHTVQNDSKDETTRKLQQDLSHCFGCPVTVMDANIVQQLGGRNCGYMSLQTIEDVLKAQQRKRPVFWHNRETGKLIIEIKRLTIAKKPIGDFNGHYYYANQLAKASRKVRHRYAAIFSRYQDVHEFYCPDENMTPYRAYEFEVVPYDYNANVNDQNKQDVDDVCLGKVTTLIIEHNLVEDVKKEYIETFSYPSEDRMQAIMQRVLAAIQEGLSSEESRLLEGLTQRMRNIIVSILNEGCQAALINKLLATIDAIEDCSQTQVSQLVQTYLLGDLAIYREVYDQLKPSEKEDVINQFARYCEKRVIQDKKQVFMKVMERYLNENDSRIMHSLTIEPSASIEDAIIQGLCRDDEVGNQAQFLLEESASQLKNKVAQFVRAFTIRYEGRIAERCKRLVNQFARGQLNASWQWSQAEIVRQVLHCDSLHACADNFYIRNLIAKHWDEQLNRKVRSHYRGEVESWLRQVLITDANRGTPDGFVDLGELGVRLDQTPFSMKLLIPEALARDNALSAILKNDRRHTSPIKTMLIREIQSRFSDVSIHYDQLKQKCKQLRRLMALSRRDQRDQAIFRSLTQGLDDLEEAMRFSKSYLLEVVKKAIPKSSLALDQRTLSLLFALFKRIRGKRDDYSTAMRTLLSELCGVETSLQHAGADSDVLVAFVDQSILKMLKQFSHQHDGLPFQYGALSPQSRENAHAPIHLTCADLMLLLDKLCRHPHRKMRRQEAAWQASLRTYLGGVNLYSAIDDEAMKAVNLYLSNRWDAIKNTKYDYTRSGNALNDELVKFVMTLKHQGVVESGYQTLMPTLQNNTYRTSGIELDCLPLDEIIVTDGGAYALSIQELYDGGDIGTLSRSEVGRLAFASMRFKHRFDMWQDGFSSSKTTGLFPTPYQHEAWQHKKWIEYVDPRYSPATVLRMIDYYLSSPLLQKTETLFKNLGPYQGDVKHKKQLHELRNQVLLVLKKPVPERNDLLIRLIKKTVERIKASREVDGVLVKGLERFIVNASVCHENAFQALFDYGMTPAEADACVKRHLIFQAKNTVGVYVALINSRKVIKTDPEKVKATQTILNALNQLYDQADTTSWQDMTKAISGLVDQYRFHQAAKFHQKRFGKMIDGLEGFVKQQALTVLTAA